MTKGWPIETPEQVIEAIRKADGDAAAELARKAMGMPPAPRRRQVPKVVGEKPRTPRAPSGVPAQSGPHGVLVPPLDTAKKPAEPIHRLRLNMHRQRRGSNDS